MDEQKTPSEPTHEPGTTKGEEAAMGEEQQKSRSRTDTSTPSDYTGVHPEGKGPIDPQSPTIPPP